MSAPGGPDVAALLCTRAHGMRRNHKSRVTPCSHCQADAQVIREAYADWVESEWVRQKAATRILSGFDTADRTHRRHADAALTALADLLRGQA